MAKYCGTEEAHAAGMFCWEVEMTLVSKLFLTKGGCGWEKGT